MPRPTKHPDRYVPALDGLRTIAVTLVVLYHLGVPGFGGGLMGVAVFFTLSGYLITTNLVSTKLRHGTFRLGTFWFRRFRRLLPAVITTLVAVLFLTVAFDSGSLGTRAAQALSALFYVNNWHTIAAGNSYFDQFAGLGPLDHMWSLSIEEQFYIFWPLLLVVLFALLRGRRRIVTATLALTAASFALMWWLAAGGTDHTRIYEGHRHSRRRSAPRHGVGHFARFPTTPGQNRGRGQDLGPSNRASWHGRDIRAFDCDNPKRHLSLPGRPGARDRVHGPRDRGGSQYRRPLRQGFWALPLYAGLANVPTASTCGTCRLSRFSPALGCPARQQTPGRHGAPPYSCVVYRFSSPLSAGASWKIRSADTALWSQSAPIGVPVGTESHRRCASTWARSPRPAPCRCSPFC